jgi:hypothetical protein
VLDRQQFFYLFLHANSLAELGLRVAADRIEAALEDEPPTAEPDGDADWPSGFDQLDFVALDGLDSL